MKNPLLSDSIRIFRFAVVAIIFALLLTLSSALLANKFTITAVVHASGLALIYGALSLLLWVIVAEGNFKALTNYQRVVNQIALLLLFLVISSGGSYLLIELLFDKKEAMNQLPQIGFELMIGTLIYLFLLNYFEKVSMISTEESVEQPAANEETEQVNSPLPTSEIIDRISVKSGTKVHLIETHQLICLISDGDYVQLVTLDGKFLKEKTMKYFEEHLSPAMFVRVHRTCIINIKMISSIEQYQKQTQLITLKNGIKVKATPAGYKALRNALNL